MHSRAVMSQRQRSILMLLLTMTIWGSTFVVTKEIMAGFPPLTLAFARVTIASLVLLPFAVARRRGKVVTSSASAAAFRPGSSRLPWGAISAMGFVGVALYYAVFNFSLVYSSASQGALVQSCLPAMTALVAVFWLREYASPVRWVGIALSMAGVAVVFSGTQSEGGDTAALGNLLMFVTTILWGIYTSLAKRVAQFDAVAITAGVTGVAALMLLPIAAIEIALQGMPRLDWVGCLGVLYLGAIASGAAYMLYNAALKHMDASQVGAYTNLVPIIGVITGVVVLGEPLSVRAIVGGAIVFAGVWVTGLQRTNTVERA
jgi:drug/metabolite transporter (DMT)-like permease